MPITPLFQGLARRTFLGSLLACCAAPALARDSEWYVPTGHSNEMRIGPDCRIVADRRIFAVMAFMNGMGYDHEADGTPMHPVRLSVRKQLAQNFQGKPTELARFRSKYSEYALSAEDYMEYAITLSPDYPFRKVGPNTGIFHEYTVTRLQDFPRVLNEFWRVGGLGRIWQAVKPDYLAELGRYDLVQVGLELDFVWRFLRMPRRESRIMVNVPNLLDRHYNAISVPCGRYFVSVEGPGSHNYALNIHEYLHEIINPEVARNLKPYAAKLLPYFDAWRRVQPSKGYDTAQNYIQECLVRAVDARCVGALHPDRKNAKIQEVAASAASGFVLARVFYDGMENFESQTLPLDQYIPVLFDKIPAA